MKGTARPPYWLITRSYDHGRLDVLVITLPSGKEVLPVFSFGEEAEMFIRLGTWETCWQGRETTARELVSALLGPCAGVEGVVLDPMPEIEAEVMVALAGVERDDFMNCFTGEEGELLDPTVKRHTLARASRVGRCCSADVGKGVASRGLSNRVATEQDRSSDPILLEGRQ